MSKYQRWNDDYVQYGFSCATEKDGTQRLQCVLCSTMFSNANMKPSKLNEHFRNRHGSRDAGNDIETLWLKRTRFDRAGTLPMYGFSPPQKPFLQASYQAAYQIAKSKKPHTVGEELIKPCVLNTFRAAWFRRFSQKKQQFSVALPTS